MLGNLFLFLLTGNSQSVRSSGAGASDQSRLCLLKPAVTLPKPVPALCRLSVGKEREVFVCGRIYGGKPFNVVSQVKKTRPSGVKTEVKSPLKAASRPLRINYASAILSDVLVFTMERRSLDYPHDKHVPFVSLPKIIETSAAPRHRQHSDFMPIKTNFVCPFQNFESR